mmetsp:Transcript_86314/g.241389  ORF Transcript_86314/g.241389 Transcript_86314/m.241389 type:complete len:284 (-) Transcript_86314:154-1005(-)
MAEGAAAASVGPPGRLVVVTGAARGIGVGICRQVLLQDAESEVVVAARDLSRAEAVAGELGARAHAIQCDVSSTSSCGQAAEAIASLRRGRALSLVNNAGVAYDLPWFPTPWPANAARDTVEVNLLGARRMTQSLLPHLLDPRSPGRVVLVSSGAGPLNMKRMAEPRRQELLAESLEWDSVEALAEEFVREYEAAAQAHEAGGPSLPFLSASGLWLQSYGFSKATHWPAPPTPWRIVATAATSWPIVRRGCSNARPGVADGSSSPRHLAMTSPAICGAVASRT